MKPKFRSFARKGLPASIILAASIVLPANALQIPVTPTGDLTVGPPSNGANYISASGGSNAAPVITVLTGVDLTGDPALLPSGTVVNVTSANYTINNSGILNSNGAGAAIASGPLGVNVINLTGGQIYSGPAATSSAITGGAGTTLSNTGSIIGVFHGIEVTGNAGAIDNNAGGIIIGNQTATTGGSAISVSGNLAPSTNAGTLNGATGISVGGTATIGNTGTISAGLLGAAGDGIRIVGTGSVTNSGTITVDPTANGSGIAFQGTGSSLVNSGSIAASGHGVYFLGNNAGFTNSGSLNGDTDGNGSGNGVFVAGNLPLGSNAAGGVIQGAGGVVVGGSGATNFTNNGTITGLALSGISAVNGSLVLTNTGAINGSVNGAEGGAGSSLLSSGNITGTTGDAVQFGNGSSIDITAGILSGGNHGVNILGDATAFSNAGSIIGNADNIGTGNGVNISGNLPSGTNSGSIQGVNGVIIGGSGATTFGNTGTITGISGNGFQAANSALALTNSSTITGQLNGVVGGASSSVTNSGTIAGTTVNGITLGDASSVINNAGSVTGASYGVYINGNAINVINSTGATITGTGNAGVGVVGNLANGTNAGTINGAYGFLVGGNAAITNTGTVNGLTQDGISVVGSLALANAAVIVGSINGVTGGDTSTVTNYGSITGTTANGILLGATGTVTNNNVILGALSGVVSGANSTVTNYSSITGTAANGLDLGTSATVQNNSSILGAINGILVTGDATSIVNSAAGSITGTGNAGVHVTNNLISGSNAGLITGASGLIVGGNATFINSGTVTGTTTDGVNAAGALTLTNSNLITGAINGALGGNTSTVINSGIITGTAGTGVGVGDNSSVNNSNLITGNIGVSATGPTAFTLTNSGTITGTGGTAVSGLAGVDTLKFNDGSIVNGDVLGGAGTDTLTFTDGLTGVYGSPDTTENIVHGGVINVENIIKTGTGFAFIGDGGVDINHDGIVDVPLQQITTDSVTVSSTGVGGFYMNGNVSPIVASLTDMIVTSGELGGTGTWKANATIASGAIFSPGAISISSVGAYGSNTDPDDAIGKVTINGDVNFNSASTYRWDTNTINSPVINSDQILGANTLTLGSGSNFAISPTSVNETVANRTYIVGTTTNGVIGDVSGVNVGVQFNSNIPDTGLLGSQTSTNLGALNTNTLFGQYFAKLSVDGKNLVLTVNHNYGDLPGLTRSESSLGETFQAASYDHNPAVQDFLASIDYSTLGDAQNLFNAISPEEQLGEVAGVMNSNYRLHRQTQNRLAGLRNAGSAPAVVQSESHTDSKGGTVASAPGISYGGKWNAWGALSYDKHEVDGDRGRLDQSDEIRAVTAGLDYRFNDSLIVGGLIDASEGDFDHNGGGSHVDSLRFAIYGTYGKSTGLYTDFLLGYNTHDIDSRRDIAGSNNVAAGRRKTSFDAEGIQGLGTVGYTFEYKGLKHGPFAGFEYQRLSVDGFHEDGVALPLPISVSDFDVDSFRGLIGYRVDGSFGRFTPYASVAYAHEFGDDEGRTKVKLGGALSGYSFTAYGPEQGSAVLVNVGTGISLTHALSLDIGYRGEFSVDGDGGDSNGGSVGLNWEF